MKLWRASFLAAKICAIALTTIALLTFRPVLLTQAALLDWRQLVVPLAFLTGAILLWSFADLFADHIATYGSVRAERFARDAGLDSAELDAVPVEPVRRRHITNRVDVLLGLIALFLLILFAALVLRAVTNEPVHGQLFGNDDPNPTAGIILWAVTAGIVAWTLLARAVRRAR